MVSAHGRSAPNVVSDPSSPKVLYGTVGILRARPYTGRVRFRYPDATRMHPFGVLMTRIPSKSDRTKPSRSRRERPRPPARKTPSGDPRALIRTNLLAICTWRLDG